jgi:flavin-dependent dehydrogenase
MAKKRHLKQDVNFLFNEIINDALLVYDMKEDEETKKNIETIIEDSSQKHQLFIDKINHPENKNISLKKYYTDLADEAVEYFNEIYSKISDLIKK